jgi:hypothetical protein
VNAIGVIQLHPGRDIIVVEIHAGEIPSTMKRGCPQGGRVQRRLACQSLVLPRHRRRPGDGDAPNRSNRVLRTREIT